MEHHERNAIEQIESLEIPKLHLWPNLNDFQTPDIDIFAVHETLGAFVIEMKSIHVDQIVEFDTGRWVTRKHGHDRSPVKQAGIGMHELVRRFSGHAIEIPFVVPTVLWSNIDRHEWRELFEGDEPGLRNMEGMLFRDDIVGSALGFERALERVRLMPAYGKAPGSKLVDPEFLAWCKRQLCNPARNVRQISDQDRVAFFEQRYESIVRSEVPIDSGTRLILNGAPGTGKTWALLALARMYAEAGRSVLFLCYNKVLRADLSRLVDAFEIRSLHNNLAVLTIFEFLDRFQDEARIGIPFLEKTDLPYDDWANLIAEEIDKHPSRIELYDLILIDEAQDMRDYVEPVLKNCIKKDGSIVIGVGQGQELYRNTDSRGWRDRFDGHTHQCDNVYRSPTQIFFVAQAVRESGLDTGQITPDIPRIVHGYCRIPEGRIIPRNPGSPLRVSRPSCRPVNPDEPGYETFVTGLGRMIRDVQNLLPDGRPLSDLLFLIPSSTSLYVRGLEDALTKRGIDYINFLDDANRLRQPKPDQVRIATYHSSRGVEAHSVVLLDLDLLHSRFSAGGTANSLIYIGLTRGTSQAWIVEPRGPLSIPGEMVLAIKDEVDETMRRQRVDIFEHAESDEIRKLADAASRVTERSAPATEPTLPAMVTEGQPVSAAEEMMPTQSSEELTSRSSTASEAEISDQTSPTVHLEESPGTSGKSLQGLFRLIAEWFRSDI